MKVRICAEKQTYSTNTDVMFLAVTDVPDPVEFIWHFGDSKSTITTSKTIMKRYHTAGRYEVVVVVSDGRTAVTSGVFLLVVQRAVRVNKLVHWASVLQNQTVIVRCRVTAGTDVVFKWSFGDGTSRLGQSTEQHVYHRMGEFRLEVTVFNLVSSALLRSHIFVVDRPCHPPPVKNMGPLKLRVQRHEVIRLGVTYEAELDCDGSDGLHYTWKLYDSGGHLVPLPLIDTHRHSVTLPSHFLHYGTYTAVARVEVVGSVVHSSYSVKVQVIQRPPVASIQGGTNVFINSKNITTITLDGQRSYDPDFPMQPVRYSWSCKPLSSIVSSCFDRHIPSSVPAFSFPAASLNQGFDQFQFTLTVHSGQSSASAKSFLSVTSSVTRKVSVDCPECEGDKVNWDQGFSVSASCDDCKVSPKQIQFTWSLYLVNTSSKPVRDIPFCSTVELGTSASVLEGFASSRHRLGTSTLHPAATNSSVYSHKMENYSETMANLMEPEPITTHESSPVSMRTEGSGEEPYYHPPGESEPPEPPYRTSEHTPPSLDDDGVLYSDHFSQTDVNELTTDLNSSGDSDFLFPLSERVDLEEQGLDYEVPVPGPQEGNPGLSAGRPTGEDTETFGPGGRSVFDPEPERDKGSNLMESRPSVVTQQPTVLDLPRDPVDRGVFESYTYSGVSSPLLCFRPFSLRPDSRYMLEVSAKSHDSLLGRTQLFLRTNPAPTGVTCQVQPVRGAELHTYFSIFCASGKEDLLYEYSFSKGDQPPRILYQGRDFQYYFHLPAGDPTNDYKVTIYTQIRSSTFGSTTKPCPVTVRVQPRFLRGSSTEDPDLELTNSGLRNLSALVQLGNSVEIYNYVSLLADILNRRSLDTEANVDAQKHTRNTLIHTMCELDGLEQALMTDNVSILKELLQVTRQVTLMSVGRVRAHAQAIVDKISESSPPHRYHIDQKTLSTLVTVLSYSLQATRDFAGVMFNRSDVTVTNPGVGEDNGNNAGSVESTGVQLKQEMESARKLIADIQQTTTDLLILKYLLFRQSEAVRVNTGLMSIYVTHQNQTSSVIRSGSASVRIPTSLIRLLFDGSRGATGRKDGGPCVLTLLMELAVNPYAWSPSAAQLTGPVVDLSLYKCSTRRKMVFRSLLQPVDIELQPAPRNVNSAHECVLLHHQVNYHSFNITHEHLHQAIQLSVAFAPSANRPFPIMLLFRMFKRPTPSMHHVCRIHRWKSNTARITLPSNYLSAPGVGYLALLNAEFEKPLRSNSMGSPVPYTLTLDTSLCLSWDNQQGVWTHHGCRTKQTDTKKTITCSCDHLRPLTVAQQQIQSSQEFLDVASFFSLSADFTALAVVLLCVGLHIPVLVLCRRADIVSKKSQRVHYLPDNCPSDKYLYAVTVHTGLCSAARMSAKVYIVLYGDARFSQTKELHVPGYSLFRRNFRDTFILSAAHCLGSVWGVHIWHDNSGPSSNWYLKQVEVSEVTCENVKGRSWRFLGECWLDVSQSDGRVERVLRVCSQDLGFTEILYLRLCDYLPDFHLWISVYTCPHPTAFTHTQRLGVCLLLLSGYAGVNTLIISQMDEQLPFAFGIIDISAVSVMTGAFSVMAVLPAVTVLSLLFRFSEVELMGSGIIRSRKTENGCLEGDVLDAADLPPVSSEDVANKDTNTGVMRKEDSLVGKPCLKQETNPSFLRMESSRIQGDQKHLLCGSRDGEFVLQKVAEVEEGGHHQAARSGHSGLYQSVPGSSVRFQWCRRLAWLLCLLLSVSCLVQSASLGMRFSRGKALMWIHSLFFSLLSCIFFIHPVMIVALAAIVSLWGDCRTAFCAPPFSVICGFIFYFFLWQLLRARQRSRFLHHVQPPAPAELKKTRRKKQKEALIGRTLRDLTMCVSMFLLMLCVTCSSSFTDRYHHSKGVRKHFLSKAKNKTKIIRFYNPEICFVFHRSQKNSFMSTEKYEDWWKWTQSSLLNLLYSSDSAKFDTIGQSQVLIGEPVLSKTDRPGAFQGQVTVPPLVCMFCVLCCYVFLLLLLCQFGLTAAPSSESLLSVWSGIRVPTYPDSDGPVTMAAPRQTCGDLSCASGSTVRIGLGHTKSEAASRLKLLHSGGWLNRQTVALMVQITLYSPAPNLFTSITLQTEQNAVGILLPSAEVQTTRIYHTPTVWDYIIMICQLLFLLLSVLHLFLQMYSVGEQGLMGYCRRPSNWLEVVLQTVIVLHSVLRVRHCSAVMEAAELLHNQSYRAHVDVRLLATQEQM
ncbi:polycystic kidney disease 1 like 1-like [Thalassophryne amazonica]|uniref:polycystic kidney disease 1 like 1-like n=1 Tax=Thalassophryne amazonica TaxID=390379 RepID=UPI001471E229|nr:polycystic kidney disease 1 like 1-like [Thalassophryne amazonica]